MRIGISYRFVELQLFGNPYYTRSPLGKKKRKKEVKLDSASRVLEKKKLGILTALSKAQVLMYKSQKKVSN